MAFRDFPAHEQGAQLLQRALAGGRLAHAYLFSGSRLAELELLAKTLAKTLNCAQPLRAPSGNAIDCCDNCPACRKTDAGNYGDVHWVRPESKLRVIRIEQIRDLNYTINLKSGEAEYKLGIVVAADRFNAESANAFLKTLEEPPPKSILVLLTIDPSRLLDTIVSRCHRLTFGEGIFRPDAGQSEWVEGFAKVAAEREKSLLGRYLVLDQLLVRLNAEKKIIEESLEARSPLAHHKDIEPDLRDKWETELKAAIEAEYRRTRENLLLALQFWLRDVWLCVLERSRTEGDAGAGTLLAFPGLGETRTVAARLSPEEALENLEQVERLQAVLRTNAQEALTLEAGLLKLHL